MVSRWLTLFACFLAYGKVWAILCSYSFIYDYQQSRCPGQEIHIATVGSLVFGLTIGGSLVVAPLLSRLSYRYIFLIGEILFALGPMASAFMPDIRYWYLTYTLPLGMGAAFINVITHATVADLFPDHLCAACTCVGVGTSFSIILMPMMWRLLLAHTTLKTTLMVFAAYIAAHSFLTITIPNQTSFDGPTSQRFAPHASVSMQIGSALSFVRTNKVNEKGQPNKTAAKFSMVKLFLSGNMLVWTGAYMLQLTFNNILCIQLTNYAAAITNNHPMAQSMFLLVAYGIGSLISKVLCAVVVEWKLLSVMLSLQTAFSLFAISLCIFGTLYYTNVIPLLLAGLYVASFLYGLGDGPIWSLAYPGTYEACRPHTDPVIFCYFNSCMAIPYCLGGPIGAAIYGLTASFPIVFYISAAAYLLSANLLWLINRNAPKTERTREEEMLQEIQERTVALLPPSLCTEISERITPLYENPSSV